MPECEAVVDKHGNVIEKGDEFKFKTDHRGATEGMVVEAHPYSEAVASSDETASAEFAGVALKYRGRNGEIDFAATDVFDMIAEGILETSFQLYEA